MIDLVAKKQGIYTIAHSHSTHTGRINLHDILYYVYTYPTREAYLNGEIEELDKYFAKVEVSVNDDYKYSKFRIMSVDYYESEKLEENDKDNLLIDIMEALVEAGFLSRTLDVQNMRTVVTKKATQMNEQLSNI